jgi:polyhydroxyalkanoate synthesis repressor PhaR
MLLCDKIPTEEADMAKHTGTGKDGDPIIIKKYANRRLYNTQSSKYITLDFLAELTRDDVEFKVLDAKSGEDITHNVLTQIIMDEESSGQNILPVGFLRQIIGMYGNSMQAMVPEFLENSLDNLKKNQEKMQGAIETAITSGPFGEIAKQNLEFVKKARKAFMPGMAGKDEADLDKSAKSHSSDEVAALKKQLAELQAKIDGMSGE